MHSDIRKLATYTTSEELPQPTNYTNERQDILTSNDGSTEP